MNRENRKVLAVSERYHLLLIMMNREMKFHWQIIVKKSRNAFALDTVKVFGDLKQNVHRVAICPGSGKSDIDQAIAAGADVYVTGDIGHHEGIDALARGLNIIDAGHYGVEHIFIWRYGELFTSTPFGSRGHRSPSESSVYSNIGKAL